MISRFADVRHAPDLDQSALLSLVASSVSWAQLGQGDLDVAYRVVDDGPLRVSLRRANLAFQLQARIESTRVTVAAVATPGSNTRWSGAPFDRECIAVNRNELDIRTTGPVTVSAIAVETSELQAAFPQSADAADLADKLTKTGVLRKPLDSTRLRAAVRSVCLSERRAPRSICGALVPLLATTLDDFDGYSVERSQRLNARFAAVRACESYMRQHLDATVTLLELSQMVRMRSRSLINAFEAVTGYSPMDYLKRLRLSGARRALQRAKQLPIRIIDVAADWGFWHMGHFTASYRSMFGETPSQTLRRG